MDLDGQKRIAIWRAIHGSIYNTLIKSAKLVDDECTIEQQPYYDEE